MGQNGQIPSILEIFCPEILFRKNTVIYHFLWYLSLVSSSIIFFNPTWPNDMESLIKKKKKIWPFSTRAWWAQVLFMIPESIKLGYRSVNVFSVNSTYLYCSWYSSPSSSGTILWMCFLWTAHILKPKILTSGSLRKAKRILNNHSMRATICLTC